MSIRSSNLLSRIQIKSTFVWAAYILWGDEKLKLKHEIQ